LTTPQSPQRPPRPDEVLAFHNGDTLENIPVIRADPPQRFPWKATTAGGTVAIVVGVCAALLLRHPAGDGHSADAAAPHVRATHSAAGTPDGKAAASSSPTAASPSVVTTPPPSSAGKPAACVHVTYKLPGGPASCEAKEDVCSPGAPWYVTDIQTLCGGPAPLQAIHVISEPATGGDPGSFYCLAWTGSSDGAGRDASLLMNAPGYQCGADLVGADGSAIQADGSSVFQASPPVCADSYPDTRMTYPAVLDFPNDGGAQPPAYVCVVADVGA